LEIVLVLVVVLVLDSVRFGALKRALKPGRRSRWSRIFSTSDTKNRREKRIEL
jgi:hypothetical protein